MELDWAWDILGEPVTDVVLPPPRYAAPLNRLGVASSCFFT